MSVRYTIHSRSSIFLPGDGGGDFIDGDGGSEVSVLIYLMVLMRLQSWWAYV